MIKTWNCCILGCRSWRPTGSFAMDNQRGKPVLPRSLPQWSLVVKVCGNDCCDERLFHCRSLIGFKLVVGETVFTGGINWFWIIMLNSGWLFWSCPDMQHHEMAPLQGQTEASSPGGNLDLCHVCILDRSFYFLKLKTKYLVYLIYLNHQQSGSLFSSNCRMVISNYCPRWVPYSQNMLHFLFVSSKLSFK